MSGGHGHDDHGGDHGSGGGGSNAMGECMFGYCEQVKGAAHQVTGIFSFLINGLFDSGGGSGGHDHGHH